MQYTSTALSGFEVDLPAAEHEIEEIAERDDLSDQEKQAVLADNAKRFFKL